MMLSCEDKVHRFNLFFPSKINNLFFPSKINNFFFCLHFALRNSQNVGVLGSLKKKMDLSDSDIDNKTPFEILAPLPDVFFQSQCVIHKHEILICGGYETNNCYSYHTIRNQYKLICSYPKDIILHGHCVVKINNNNNNNLNEITLLSFSGSFKYALIMNYISVWDNDNKKEEEKKDKYNNEWIPFKDNNNDNISICIDKNNYEGMRAVIGGSNNHLLFITYPPQNISVFNLNTFQYVNHNNFPSEDYWISYHCFISKINNKNEMILFYKKTGLIIDYNENNNLFQFYKISVCDKEIISDNIYKYSIAENKWMKLDHILPKPLFDCTAILNNDNTCVHIIGGKDDNNNIVTMHTKMGLRNEEIKQEDKPKISIETLDLKKHWSEDWIKSNVEGAKIVKEILDKNEQGLIVITNNVSEWKNKIHSNENETKEYINSFYLLVNNDNIIEKKQIGDYWIYTIKRKLIIFDDVTIDGNVYAVNCEIQSQGKINITTQIFVTENVIIDETLKQSITPILWDMKIHHDVLVQLQNLEDKQQQCSEKDLLDDAIIYSQQHLQICIDTFGSNHPFVANSYNNLGLVYEDKGQYNKAIESYERSIKIILDVFGNNHAWSINVYNNLGDSYDKKRYYRKAIEYYTKALEIRLNILGTNHGDVALSYNNVGYAYNEARQYDQAIECHQKALKIKLDIYGNNHSDVASSYNNLGYSYSNKGQHDEAIQCHEKALKIRLDLFGNSHIDVAWSYNNLGFTYNNKGCYSNAIECHENALKIMKEISGSMSEEVADSYWSLGHIFEKQGEMKTACKYFEEAWKVYSGTLGEWEQVTLQAKEKVKKLIN
ncbi:hypothetical protein RFI_24575 [Reticulomyxa filosa]|uniref:Uncharacterized protein n=1 Tax=Reticulomyxa filosa TaxID=46433 RepID=X6MH96_RETFI|nr:hypothetical protein RFI_24575 [Reticulomyxa filosa]|eukprot:ETO12802.1 hypothetical protein RFI_24575 [Reticulomyxa filosa]